MTHCRLTTMNTTQSFLEEGMNKKTLSIGVVLILATAALGVAVRAASAKGMLATSPQSTSTEPAPRTITVFGSGKVLLTPDIAYIQIGVRTEDKDAAEAVAGNTSQSQKVIDAIKAAGIENKDIQTTNFSIFPQQQYDSQGKPTGEITYVVENTVYVTVRKIAGIGDLLNETVKAGANTINSIQFDVSDKTKALSEARKAAVADAKTQAEELATAAGVKIVEVQSINSTDNYPVTATAKFLNRAGALDSASVPVSAGQLTLEVNVSVVYVID